MGSDARTGLAAQPREAQPLMLFDADCGFCAKTAGRVPQLGARVRAQSLQSADLAALGVDAQRAEVEMPVVLPDGRVVWGHHAWAAVLKTASPPLRVVGGVLDAAVFEPVFSRLYHWVASHRDRLPGGTPACALPAYDPPLATEGQSD